MIKQKLNSIRTEIDKIDNKILSLLGKRADFVKQAGLLKKSVCKEGTVIRAAREATMLRKLAEHPPHNLPPLFLAQMWRLIISVSLGMEENFKVGVLAQNRDQNYWHAREYFGAFSRIDNFHDPKQLFDSISKSDYSVVVFEACDEVWQEFIKRKKIKIFAIIPYVYNEQEQDSPRLFAASVVDSEETGNDRTIFSTRNKDVVDDLLGDFKVLYNDKQDIVVDIEGFYDVISLQESFKSSHLLGHYSPPIILK